VNQAEQRPSWTAGRLGPFGFLGPGRSEVVPDEMRLARADLDGPVGS
jgi:hypothetical protein